jgi:endonuclease YncB( thermonuclease family)
MTAAAGIMRTMTRPGRAATPATATAAFALALALALALSGCRTGTVNYVVDGDTLDVNETTNTRRRHRHQSSAGLRGLWAESAASEKTG